MNSSSDKSQSSRRVRGEESTESKRQRSEKEAKPREQKTGSYDVVLEIRTGLSKIEAKLDRITRAIKDGSGKYEKSESEERVLTSDMGGLFDDLRRIDAKMTKHSEVEEILLGSLKQKIAEAKKTEKILSEVRMERDVLLEKMHGYLEQNSSLKSKIEEQRCSIGAYERQVNAEYEIRLRKLESVNEDLRNAAVQKDKQLKEANDQLKQMCKMLKTHETLSWKKKNEETVFISILKNDLQAIWNEKIKMEEEFKRLKRLCGYSEQEVQPRLSSEDYLGTLLRRSKSMSDLTAQTSAIDGSERASSRLSPNAPRRHPSKNAHEGSGSETVSLASGAGSKQKMVRDEGTVERKLS